jgi:hypothetical protein
MREYPKRLEAAGIDKLRLFELSYICKQYRGCKRKIDRARAGIVDRRKGSGAWRLPDPTGNAAVNIAAMPEARRVRMIEQAANEVAPPSIAEAIITSACDGVPYEKMRKRPPCGRNQFYTMRMDFFIRLDGMLWESEQRRD